MFRSSSTRKLQLLQKCTHLCLNLPDQPCPSRRNIVIVSRCPHLHLTFRFDRRRFCAFMCNLFFALFSRRFLFLFSRFFFFSSPPLLSQRQVAPPPPTLKDDGGLIATFEFVLMFVKGWRWSTRLRDNLVLLRCRGNRLDQVGILDVKRLRDWNARRVLLDDFCLGKVGRVATHFWLGRLFRRCRAYFWWGSAFVIRN